MANSHMNIKFNIKYVSIYGLINSMWLVVNIRFDLMWDCVWDIYGASHMQKRSEN